MEKLRKVVFNVIIYSFIGIMIWTVLMGILDYDTIIFTYNPIILCIGILLYILILINVNKRLVPKLVKNKHIPYVLFAIFFILSLTIGCILRVNPSWDMGAVFNIAKSFATTNSFDGSMHLLIFPNNIMITIIYMIIFKIVSIFNVSNFVLVATIFNGILVTCTVIMTYYIAKMLFDDKKALMVLLIMLFTSPLYLYVPIYYTDTLAMFFSTLILLLMLLIEKYTNKKINIPLQILLGLIIVIAWKAKITSIFVVIATIVWYTIKGFKVKDLKKISLVLPVSLVFLLTYNLVIGSKINNNEATDRVKVPIEYWILTGLTGTGVFNQEISDTVLAGSTLSEKKQIGREKIKEVLNSYTANEFIKHLNDKLKYAWTDGSYFAPEKLRREPVQRTLLHEIVLEEGKYSSYYKYFPQIMHITLLILIIISSIDVAKKQDYLSKKNILIISMYGLLVFLLIWENRSRYILVMLPIFLLLGVDGIEIIQNKLLKNKKSEA